MTLTHILLVLLFIAVIIFIYFIGSAISLWVQALVSGAAVGLFNIVFMRFRKVAPRLVVNATSMAANAGLYISTNHLERPYPPRGAVTRVVPPLPAADKANIDLIFTRAVA